MTVGRPGQVTLPTQGIVPRGLPPGLHTIPSGRERLGLLQVPPRSEVPVPLLVVFHDAGARAEQAVERFGEAAGIHRVVLLAPDATAATWDLFDGGFGPDVTRLSTALAVAADALPVDRDRLGVGGFGDGASYALSVGLGNGDLFAAIVAFAPGVVTFERQVDQPRVFVAQGSSDPVMEAEATRNGVLPLLRAAGLEVRYEEFTGGHEVPGGVAAAALAWFVGQNRSGRAAD